MQSIFFYRRISFVNVSFLFPFTHTYTKLIIHLEKSHISLRLDLHAASRDFHVRARTTPARRNFSVTSSKVFAAPRTPTRMQCTHSHAAYVLQARWTKLWPVSIGRALRVVYTGRPSGVATRDLTQIGETAPAVAATHSEPVGPSIVQANVVHALRNCRPVVRFNGEKPVNFAGIKSIKVR